MCNLLLILLVILIFCNSNSSGPSFNVPTQNSSIKSKFIQTRKKYGLYYLGEKIKESDSKEWLIMDLNSIKSVCNENEKVKIDSDYEIKEL